MIPQTPSLMLFTYRPEYRGALSRVAGAQSIALAPLSDSETAALVLRTARAGPLGWRVGQLIAERTAGNPFFVEEMVRDLAERGVLLGAQRCIMSRGDMPMSACRLPCRRPSPPVSIGSSSRRKRTLNAAAVIGLRFGHEQLALLDGEAERGRFDRCRTRRPGAVHRGTPSTCSTIR